MPKVLAGRCCHSWEQDLQGGCHPKLRSTRFHAGPMQCLRAGLLSETSSRAPQRTTCALEAGQGVQLFCSSVTQGCCMAKQAPPGWALDQLRAFPRGSGNSVEQCQPAWAWWCCPPLRAGLCPCATCGWCGINGILLCATRRQFVLLPFLSTDTTRLTSPPPPPFGYFFIIIF